MQDRAFSTGRASPVETGLLETIAEGWPPERWRDLPIGVAVSGGADSVSLLCVIARLKATAGGRGSVAVLHFDHRARSDSAADARWVRELAADLGLPCESGRRASSGPHSEEALRDERRGFFRRTAGKLGLRHIATGHHADDQAETVLFRLLRGSGLDGLTGIRRTARLTDDCSLVRPMLAATRADARGYLEEAGQAWREDASNGETLATRNWLRHEVLPKLEQRFPEARRALLGVSDEAQSARERTDAAAEALLFKAEVLACDSEVSLNAREMLEADALVAVVAIRRLWRRAGWPEQAMTRRHWEWIPAVAAGGKPVDLPGGVHAELLDGRLVLRRC